MFLTFRSSPSDIEANATDLADALAVAHGRCLCFNPGRDETGDEWSMNDRAGFYSTFFKRQNRLFYRKDCPLAAAVQAAIRWTLGQHAVAS